MKVAVVNIQYHEGNNLFPPLGALYIAAALREAGHHVLVLDGDPELETDLLDRVVHFAPDVVGLSFLTMTWTRARDFAQGLRVRLPHATLVAGGAHATVDPEGTVEGLGVDFAVVGEGEATIVEALAALECGSPVKDIAGVCTPDGRGPERPLLEDVDAIPFPARDLIDFSRYMTPPGVIRGYAHERVASVLSSRGCPFKCIYCASHRQLGRSFRQRSIDNVLAEVDHLVERYRVKGLYWVDDVLTMHRSWLLEFCRRLEGRHPGLVWGCQSRVNSVDRELLEAMKAAGCVQVDFGVESGSERVLGIMKKGTKPHMIVKAFDLAHDVGLRTGASFIFGTPGETEADIDETLAMAKRIRSDWTVFFFSTPYPGTDLWRLTVEEGYSQGFPSYGEAWNNRQNQQPFAQGALTPEYLESVRKRAQNTFFASNYLRARNLPYAAKLAQVVLCRPRLAAQTIKLALTGGRLDDLVEAAFAAHREQITVPTRSAPRLAPAHPSK